MKQIRSQNCKDSSLGILANMHWLYWKAGDIFRKPVLTAAKAKTGNFEIGNLKVNDHCSHSEVVQDIFFDKIVFRLQRPRHHGW